MLSRLRGALKANHILVRRFTSSAHLNIKLWSEMNEFSMTRWVFFQPDQITMVTHAELAEPHIKVQHGRRTNGCYLQQCKLLAVHCVVFFWCGSSDLHSSGVWRGLFTFGQPLNLTQYMIHRMTKAQQLWTNLEDVFMILILQRREHCSGHKVVYALLWDIVINNVKIYCIEYKAPQCAVVT